jgi:hypothetical protein
MELEINEGGIWVDKHYVSWDDILERVVETYPKGSLTDVKAVRAIVEELKYLANDIEEAY